MQDKMHYTMLQQEIKSSRYTEAIINHPISHTNTYFITESKCKNHLMFISYHSKMSKTAAK